VHAEKKKELGAMVATGCEVSIIFDGTPWQGIELFAVVTRFVTWVEDEAKALAAFRMLCGSMNQQEQASILWNVCIKDPLHLDFEQVIGAKHERAAKNGAALRQMSGCCRALLPLPCLSHAIARVSVHFHKPVSDKFIVLWTGLFAKSYKARTVWANFVDNLITINQFGNTRWWATFEAIFQAMQCWGDINEFFNGDLLDGSLAPKKVEKLEVLVNPADPNYPVLLVVMAIYCDASKKTVQGHIQAGGWLGANYGSAWCLAWCSDTPAKYCQRACQLPEHTCRD